MLGTGYFRVAPMCESVSQLVTKLSVVRSTDLTVRAGGPTLDVR